MIFSHNIHVLPIDDIKEHEETWDCWCEPKLIEEKNGNVIVHNSLDGREFEEEGKGITSGIRLDL